MTGLNCEAFAWPAGRVAGLLFRLAAAVVLALHGLSTLAHEGEEGTLDFSKAPADVLPWGYLAKVGVRYVDDRIVPLFLPPVLALDRKRVTLYGYMTPVDSGSSQRRFLLSWRPIFCAGCERPIGPEGIVEVNMLRPVASTREALAVRGELRVLQNDPMNILYRMHDATVVTRFEARKADSKGGPRPARSRPTPSASRSATAR